MLASFVGTIIGLALIKIRAWHEARIAVRVPRLARCPRLPASILDCNWNLGPRGQEGLERQEG